MSRVVKFVPRELGERFRSDPDEILADARGAGFTSLIVIGHWDDVNPGEDIWIGSNANVGETVLLLERAKHKLIHGDPE